MEFSLYLYLKFRTIITQVQRLSASLPHLVAFLFPVCQVKPGTTVIVETGDYCY
jgi:hypothetical protein